MYRIYEMWRIYAMFIVEAVFSFCKWAESLPDVVAMMILTLPVFAIILFLPHWAALSLGAAIGFPMIWFLGAMFGMFFSYDIGRQYR